MSEYHTNSTEPGSGSLKKRLFLYGPLIVIIGGIIAAIVFSGKWDSGKKIENITIEGNNLLRSNEILGMTKDKLIGKVKDSIDLDKISEMVEANRFVEKAVVSFSGFDEVMIEISERKPVAYVTDQNGNLFFADNYGKVFPFRKNSAFSDLPVLRNFIRSGKADVRKLRQAAAIIREFDEADDPDVRNVLSEIVFNTADKSFELIAVNNGLRIKFGKPDRLPEKIRKIRKFFKKFDQAEIDKLRYIDVRWKDRLIAAWI